MCTRAVVAVAVAINIVCRNFESESDTQCNVEKSCGRGIRVPLDVVMCVWVGGFVEEAETKVSEID
jgi:hypothetical protein